VNRLDGRRFGDHVCWPITEVGFAAAALPCLAEGLDQGQRVVYAAPESTDVLVADLQPLGDIERFISSGQVVVHQSSALYAGDLDPASRVSVFRRMTDVALACGYTGVRVAADLTYMAADPTSTLDLLIYELLIDRWLATGAPAIAVCAFDAAAGGASALEMFEAVHPMCRRRSSHLPFHLQGTREGVAVVGEIDSFIGPRFTTGLSAASGATGNPIVLDFIGVDFAGVDAMYRLATFATAMADQSRLVVLRDALPVVRRAWDLVAATMKAEISFV
jgi:hypothetical protein